MEAMFQPYRLGNLELANRFVFPPFQTVILASGMHPAPGPDADIQNAVAKLEIIGDANEVQDIFSAVHAGYELAQRY
jgi:hypothetical protein